MEESKLKVLIERQPEMKLWQSGREKAVLVRVL